MTEKLDLDGLPATRKKYTPAFNAECGRQVAAGTRQTNVARAQGISQAPLGRWQRQAPEQAVPSSAECDEIKRPLRPQITAADPTAVVTENRLLGRPAPTAPNQAWVGDIAYLSLMGGRWCYLATWRDA